MDEAKQEARKMNMAVLAVSSNCKWYFGSYTTLFWSTKAHKTWDDHQCMCMSLHPLAGLLVRYWLTLWPVFCQITQQFMLL